MWQGLTASLREQHNSATRLQWNAMPRNCEGFNITAYKESGFCVEIVARPCRNGTKNVEVGEVLEASRRISRNIEIYRTEESFERKTAFQ